ncbi:MAG: DUF4435 domain-containing protein [Polyangiaceae bacterium]|jgi:hypothetical protein|nr:DUF4435 domain-containing protein [Polyangiaceae bacterium]
MNFDDDLYSGPITLIVEDATTRAFLQTLWADKDIHFRVGAGHEGVAALAHGASGSSSRVKIVGLVDRDFAPDNKARWRDLSVTVLRLTRHEIENYFLDWSVLEKLSSKSRKRSAQEIESEARNHARRRIWWMAGKRILRKMREDFIAGFPEDPAISSTTDEVAQENVISHLCEHSFWRNLTETQRRWTAPQIRKMVIQEGEKYQHDLSSQTWLETFSGKEIVRHLRSYAGLDPPGSSSSPAERDQDLGRKVADSMRKQRLVPADLSELRDALRYRANLPPGG